MANMCECGYFLKMHCGNYSEVSSDNERWSEMHQPQSHHGFAQHVWYTFNRSLRGHPPQTLETIQCLYVITTQTTPPISQQQKEWMAPQVSVKTIFLEDSEFRMRNYWCGLDREGCDIWQYTIKLLNNRQLWGK